MQQQRRLWVCATFVPAAIGQVALLLNNNFLLAADRLVINNYARVILYIRSRCIAPVCKHAVRRFVYTEVHFTCVLVFIVDLVEEDKKSRRTASRFQYFARGVY